MFFIRYTVASSRKRHCPTSCPSREQGMQIGFRKVSSTRKSCMIEPCREPPYEMINAILSPNRGSCGNFIFQFVTCTDISKLQVVALVRHRPARLRQSTCEWKCIGILHIIVIDKTQTDTLQQGSRSLYMPWQEDNNAARQSTVQRHARQS